MADTTETLILDVQIDQSDAQRQLVQTEQTMNRLKKEAADLRKEYNAGKISEEQYAEASLKIQKAQKTEAEQKRTLTKLVDTESNSRNALKARVSQLTKEYDNLNRNTKTGAERANQLEKELKELNAEITKSSKGAGLFKDQIGNYPEAMKAATNATVPFGQSIAKATDEVQPFGVSVSGATASVSKFLNPATAAVGVLALLGTAYANSTVGARDLQQTQDLLAASTEVLTNRVGDFIGTTESGQGVISTFTQTLLLYLDAELGAASAAKAAAVDRLRQLEITEAFAKGAAKDAERRAEDARRIRDDEKQDLNERLEQTQKIEQELKNAGALQVGVFREQQNAIKAATTNYEKNREAILKVTQLEAEIADKNEEINGKLTENLTARRAILELIREQAELEAGVARANQRLGIPSGAAINRLDTNRTETGEELLAAQQTQDNIINARADSYQTQLAMAEKFGTDLLKFNKDLDAAQLKSHQDMLQLKNQADLMELDFYADILGSASSLFEQSSAQYKFLATAQTLISTYSAAQKSYEALAGITVVGPALGAAAAAAAVAAGLARVAQINGIQFAEGGYTGEGKKYDVAGIVHKGEYVAPQHVVNNPTAKPHLKALENMRVRGFADGGFTTNESISSSQQALIMANAMKNLPPVYASWTEGRRVGRRVEFREKVSKL